MTKQEYQQSFRRLAQEYSVGQINFEELQNRIIQLEDHEHAYERNVSGEKVCWCGASQ